MTNFLSLGSALMLVVASALVRADTIEVSDYLEYERVDDAQISPDGSQVIFTRRWVDQKTDRWSSALWIMDSDGSRQRVLVKGANARWSPSGDRILYLAKGANGKSQILVRWISDGATSQVTRGELTPKSPSWSPDGKHIAFAAVVPEDNDWKIDLPKKPVGAKWTEPPRILNDLHYRQDKVGYTESGYSHLFVVPAESGTARQLTSGSWNVGARRSPDGLFSGAQISWTPDGAAIVVDGFREDREPSAYRRSDIYRISVDKGDISQLTNEPGYWTEPSISEDGKRIVFEGHPLSKVTYELADLYVMNADGGDVRLLASDFDRPVVGDKQWSGKDLVVTVQDSGYFRVYRISPLGTVTAVTEEGTLFRLSSITPDGSVIAGIRSSYYEPGDVATIDLSSRGGETRLTQVNADLLAGKTLGKQEEIWFEAEDGNKAHGWIVYPPDFDSEQTYPMIMEIHGGPFSMYRGSFNFFYQAYAANGFVVLYTNPRGSTGYGEEFSQAIDHAYPSVDYLDLMGAVDAVLEQGVIDDSRMYVGGCSGGGVLTSWVIGHTNRFAAASVRCPVTNWISMLGQTDIPNFTQSFFKKPFWEDPSDWLHHSPIMYVGSVKTPTIVMTGEQDLRTPMAQSEEYYAALKLAGVPAKLMRFNEQYHGTSTHPSNAMRTMLYLISWYNQYDINGERGGAGSKKAD
ncbi:S9 family peptidase [Gammaproteobacteria bacterium]|nr:S9 family peptidase [Gammaproteobacteria bacterium]